MIEIENAADEISSVSDVSYLLTWLRLAKRKLEFNHIQIEKDLSSWK